MIGKITTGSSFNKLFDYLFKPDKAAEIIGGNYYSGQSPKKLTAEFEMIASQRTSTKKPVKHLIISFAPDDGRVDEQTKYLIAHETVQNLGYTENQWVAVSHQRDDSDHYEAHAHDHMHIVVNMITYSGSRTSDSFDKRRMMKILRELEIKHQLTRVKSSFERLRRRPKQGRYKKFERAYYQYVEQMKEFVQQPLKAILPKPPREPEIQELETFVAAATSDRPTMSLYLARMQKLGYRVEEYEGKVNKRTGKPRKRFRYYLKCNQKPICKVNGASRAQLIKYGVDYLPERDDPNILKASLNLPVDIPEYQIVNEEMVEQSRYDWLSEDKRQKLRQTVQNWHNNKPRSTKFKLKPEIER